MSNPNATGNNETKTGGTNTEWDSLREVEFAGGLDQNKVIGEGEVSRIIEDGDGKQKIESAYDLRASDKLRVDENIVSFITPDLAKLDLCKDFLEQLSKNGSIDSKQLSSETFKLYDAAIYHLQIVANPEYREQARLVMDKVKDIGQVGNFFSRLFNAAVELNDGRREKLFTEKELKDVFNYLEEQYADVTNVHKGFDTEKASELLDYYNVLLKNATSPAMEETIKNRMERLHSLLHGAEFISNKISQL